MDTILRELKLEKYAPAFREQNITVETFRFLIQEIDGSAVREMILSKCDMSIGDFLKICQQIRVPKPQL